MERPKVRKRCAVCGRPLPLKGDSELSRAGVRIETRGQQTLYYCPLHRNNENPGVPVFVKAIDYEERLK